MEENMINVFVNLPSSSTISVRVRVKDHIQILEFRIKKLLNLKHVVNYNFHFHGNILVNSFSFEFYEIPNNGLLLASTKAPQTNPIVEFRYIRVETANEMFRIADIQRKKLENQVGKRYIRYMQAQTERKTQKESQLIFETIEPKDKPKEPSKDEIQVEWKINVTL